VADLRAPTPTAAAELITPVTIQDLIEGIDELRRRMISDVESTVINLRQMALAFVDGRAARRLTERVHQRSQRIDDLTTRASRAVLQNVQLRRLHIDHTVALLSSLHPLAPLQRGYAVLERDGRVINAGVLLSPGEVIDIRRQHDVVRATVNETHSTDNNTGS
jgi:exodeoxyribonuclease VII large subunit